MSQHTNAITNAEIMEKLCEIEKMMETMQIEPKVSKPKASKKYVCDYCEKDTYIDSKGKTKDLSRRSRLQNCDHGFCRPCLVEYFKDSETNECPIEGCSGYMPDSKMEELKHPGAKGRRVAQEKRRKSDEEHETHETHEAESSEPEKAPKKVPKVPKKKAPVPELEISSEEEELNDLAEEIESAF